MPSGQAFARSLCAVAVVVLACALGSCSSGSGSGGTSFDAALSHIADTPGTRAQISYDDTAELVRLSGADAGTTKGFAAVRGWGASSVGDYSVNLASDTGISLFSEDYAISAGNPPQTVTLLHGGQNASLVTSRLTKLGWKQGGGMLTGPAVNGDISPDVEQYVLPMHVVRTDGSDVTFGGPSGNLGEIGSSPGSTLAGDPLISALANCLGDVVAAQVSVGGDLGGRNPAAVALGVRTPASNAATPHAVVCVAWSSQAEAAQYAADARKALSSGISYPTNQPFSALLTHPSVTSIGGSQNIIQWQADTPKRADLIFEMLLDRGLPALPDCTRLTPLARGRLIGCA